MSQFIPLITTPFLLRPQRQQRLSVNYYAQGHVPHYQLHLHIHRVKCTILRSTTMKLLCVIFFFAMASALAQVFITEASDLPEPKSMFIFTRLLIQCFRHVRAKVASVVRYPPLQPHLCTILYLDVACRRVNCAELPILRNNIS